VVAVGYPAYYGGYYGGGYYRGGHYGGRYYGGGHHHGGYDGRHASHYTNVSARGGSRQYRR
jgi:hypothetical protein